jgi:hypothetical protein
MFPAPPIRFDTIPEKPKSKEATYVRKNARKNVSLLFIKG